MKLETIRVLRLAAAAAMFTLAGAASAATTLILSGPIPDKTVGPQSSSNPCIIAGTTCQQPAGFGYNNFTQTGNISAYNMYSTTPTAAVPDGTAGTPYTVAQLTALGSTQFLVAIDVNTTGAAGETLLLFEVIIGGVQQYVYTGGATIGNVNNNGNGWADYTLGTIDLSGYAPGHHSPFPCDLDQCVRWGRVVLPGSHDVYR